MDTYYTWVYILESPDGGHWTVGAARDLTACFEYYRAESSPHFPSRMVALYRFAMSEEENDGLGASHPASVRYEKHIAAQMMKRVGSEWHNVISLLGQFEKGSRKPPEVHEEPFPTVCFCGYPAELRYSMQGRPYYSCCRKNRGWLTTKPFPNFLGIEAHKTCGFYSPLREVPPP